MLRTRIVTALAALGVVVAALFLLPPHAFALAVLALLALGAHEWARLAGMGANAHVAFVALFAAIGLTLVFLPAAGFTGQWPRGLLLCVCAAATLFWLLVATPWVVRRWQVRGHIALALAGLVVLVGAFVAIVALRGHSPWTLLAAMAVVWIADTAAYFAGRALGRRKLAPQVSPGKTWEGLAGGLAGVALYALVLLLLAPDVHAQASHPARAIGWVVLAVVVAALSAIGDLFESWQKRQAGMKDSGTLLPGHGGVLDRIDALVAAMPPLALAATLWLPG